MKSEIGEQLAVAMNSGGVALTAVFRVVLLSVMAVCMVAIVGLGVIDQQLSEHQEEGARDGGTKTFKGIEVV